MVRFSYKAKEGPGKILTATIEAPNLNSAIEKIIQSGLTPIDVHEVKKDDVGKKILAASSAALRQSHVSLPDKVLFTQQMSDLVEASVPILRSLQLVISQTRNLHFKERLTHVYDNVKDGESLSMALARHPDIFSPFYINLVRSGEVSGQLENVLKRLAHYLEDQNENRKKVINSLSYPVLIFGVGLVTIFILLTFVLPRVAVMFEDIGQTLPLITRIVIAVSHFLAKSWWIFVVLALGGGIYLKQFLGSSDGRQWFDRWIMKVPLLGNFIRINEISRFARTMATMIETGVPMTSALSAVEATAGNGVLKGETHKLLSEVTHGQSLTQVLRQSEFFTEMAINMISVGEETGHLEQAFHKVADVYEREADNQAKRMITWLGPLTLIIVVGIVGFVVVAMLLPILTMNLVV